MFLLRKIHKRSFTLVELIIAVFVLSVGIVSTLLFFTNAMLSAEFAGDITIATTHAEHIFEEMQSRKTLTNITATDWPSWAEEQGLNTLTNEYFDIQFANTESNPLDVEATISWTKKSRTNNVKLITSIMR